MQINTDIGKFGLILGALLFIVILVLPTPEGMNEIAWKTTAVAVLMAIWWITEAIPIAITSLLPIVLLPILGVAPIGDSTAPYANPLIFLFMGGFMIALAMQRWELHKRIAIKIIAFVGVKPSSIIIGFIIASAFLSMWVSNTATALMMLPIALSVLHFADSTAEKTPEVSNFEVTLVLAIAYACNIGGIATLIGTPPNALFAGFMLENYSIEISFVSWMSIGVPLVLVLLPLMYFYLTKIAFPITLKELPGGKEVINQQLQKIGTISTSEKRVAVVFTLAAALWIFRPLLAGIVPGLSDAGIAIAAGAILFIVPSGNKHNEKLLAWKDMTDLPWGILLLFGGGLSLAMAISSSGLATWIGESVKSLEAFPILILVFAVIFIVVFLTEITSNTATTAAFIPILASTAIGMGQNPLLFIIPAAISASCAFMLPVATPPNAIIYGSGKISIGQMAKAGLWLNVAISIILTLATYTLFAYIFGIEVDVIPDWVQ